ncbi:MAG: EthD domain-containing protein [Deltaproteobacteria bacterium]|jgi:hypothetical protein|nr:EthD domain-containing protein [Deltaproteobacteria bacterium]
MTEAKAILIGREPHASLQSYVESLGLPRRALSLPATSDPPPDFHCFVELWGAEDALRDAVGRWPFEMGAWLVEESTPKRYERVWRSGTASPGIRMVSILHRRPGLSREAFAAHWLGPHTRVALSFTIPFWQYSQNVVVEPLANDAGEDGFVGMHFETREQMEARWSAHPEEAARGLADAEQFMDTSRNPTVVTIETVWEK